MDDCFVVDTEAKHPNVVRTRRRSHPRLSTDENRDLVDRSRHFERTENFLLIKKLRLN